MNSDSGLEFFTDDELIEELKRRCSGLVVGMIKERDAENEEYSLFWRGGLCLCIGISERTTARLINLSLDSRSVEPDPEIEEE